MANFDAVTRDHVLLALDEYDRDGDEVFLSRYGFGRAREYVVWRDGKTYDSKAILGVALRYATGAPATSAEFSGGRDGAAKSLQSLGFEVASVSDVSETQDSPTSGAWLEAADVGTDAARSAWADAARDNLIDTAKQYHAVVTYKELAGLVQSRTGIRTKQLMHYWIGDVLGRVAAECTTRGEPILSSLCVNSGGSVGDGYAVAVLAARGETPADPDVHAAAERLECYRHFGAELPAGGGTPALTARLAASRERVRRVRVAERPALVCPTCNTNLPATGTCDYCD